MFTKPSPLLPHGTIIYKCITLTFPMPIYPIITTPQCRLQQHSPDRSTASPEYSLPTVPSLFQENSNSRTPASTTLSNALPYASSPPASNPAMSLHSPSPTPLRSSPPSLFHCEHKENNDYLIFPLLTIIISNSFLIFSVYNNVSGRHSSASHGGAVERGLHCGRVRILFIRLRVKAFDNIKRRERAGSSRGFQA